MGLAIVESAEKFPYFALCCKAQASLVEPFEVAHEDQHLSTFGSNAVSRHAMSFQSKKPSGRMKTQRARVASHLKTRHKKVMSSIRTISHPKSKMNDIIQLKWILVPCLNGCRLRFERGRDKAHTWENLVAFFADFGETFSKDQQSAVVICVLTHF